MFLLLLLHPGKEQMFITTSEEFSETVHGQIVIIMKQEFLVEVLDLQTIIVYITEERDCWWG